jgi:hypothetical protein
LSTIPVLSATTNQTSNIQALDTAIKNSPQFANVLAVQSNPFVPQDIKIATAFQYVLKHLHVKTEPQGFGITVTATLKQPLTAPTVPGAAPGTGLNGTPGG